MTDKARTKWPDQPLDAEKILLDWKNPRIDANDKSTQEEIRTMLLEDFEIVELAQGIIKSGGNMAGERIIVVQENGKYVVLEGNRRTSTCQMLVNPGLIPPAFKGKFPAADKAVKDAIAKLDAVIAPSRAAAEPIITRRHTEPGILKWTPMAKQRRIVNMTAEGQSPEAVATALMMSESAVLKTLREYHLLNYTRSLPTWNQTEKSRLDSPKLKPNPFTRFFTLGGVKKRIGLQFNPKGEVETTLDRKVFDKAMGAIAREMLLPDPKTWTAKKDTRATPDEVFKAAFTGDKDLEPLAAAKTSAKSAKRGKTSVKGDRFFESLSCPIQDNRLARVSEEIKKIDYHQLPTAATFLLRALIEATVDYCIKRYKLGGDLRTYYVQRRWPNGGAPKQIGEPELDHKIHFLATKVNVVFNSAGATNSLTHWLSVKNYSNQVIHGQYADANATILEAQASLIRPLILKIFDGSVLKP